MDVFVGTSGYSYKEWKGSFYPEKLPAKKMLGFYAEHFGSVEINNTFYRMPKPDVLRTWVEQVPEDFRFVVKASRRITHIKRLKDPKDNLPYLFEVTEALGAQRGAIYFQTPPNMKLNLERFDAFLAELPDGLRMSMELRHASWDVDEVKDRLRAKNMAWVVVDSEPEVEEGAEPPPRVMTEIQSTADWGYFRLRRCDYTEAEVGDWADRILAQPWKAAYVFFKHEDEGTGPAMAQLFLRALADRR